MSRPKIAPLGQKYYFENVNPAINLFRVILGILVLLVCSTNMPGKALAVVTITGTTDPTGLATAIATGNNGITLTGTPTLSAGSSTTSSGTFSTTGSNLGIAGGIVLSSGNIGLIAGSAPGPGNLSAAGSGVGNAGTNEFDISILSFSFIPKPGVVKISIASVFISEEYNEYVNSAYSDNFSIVVNGGVYTNTNIATVPGTGQGTDINTVNNGTNSGYYRDNTVAPYPIPDIKFDGATKVLYNAFAVVPGTTYAVTIRIADVGDAQYDSAAFVSTSTIVNNPPSLDLSTTASGTGYSNTWVESKPAVAIADTAGVTIEDDGTTISSATITLNSPLATDLLSVIGTLPVSITASSYSAGSGVITLSGLGTLAEYQSALQMIGYSSSATNPTGPAHTVSVVLNDGVDDSNIAVSTIAVAALSVTKAASSPTVNKGTNLTLTDASDTITYTYTVKNEGTVTLTAASPVDAGPQFNGMSGTGTLSAFVPVSATLATGATQVFTATYTLSATDIINGGGIPSGVTNKATAKGNASSGITANSSSASASTTITTVAALTITKTAGTPTIAAGANTGLTDAGDTITFTYLVKNVGSVALTNIAPTDAGPKFNGVTGTNALSSFTPATVATLAIGATQTFAATYTLSAIDVKNAVGIVNGVTNTAAASGKNGATTITAANSSASTTIADISSLTIIKTYVLNDLVGGSAGKADINETISYTYVVSNNGNVPIGNVQVQDLHGSPMILVSLGASGITSETLTTAGPLGAAASSDATPNDSVWDVLAPGATVTFSWTHTVTQSEIDHG